MLELNFIPFPVLETERLILTRPFMGDAEDFFALRSDPRIMKYIPRPLAKTIEDAKTGIRQMDEYLEKGEGINWFIKMKGSDRMIGNIGFYRTQHQNYRSELGYILHSDFWGKGIISESVQAALHYGFHKMNLHSIEALIDPVNVKSGAVLERNYFVKEALFRENCYFEGVFTDSAVYSLLKSRYLALSGQAARK